MQSVDLVIRGGKLVGGEGILEAALAIHNGQIVAVAEETVLPPAREVIDAQGRYVLPGLIDPHVHLRDPGHTEREDWTTGTMAAAAGGVTTVIDHPNSVPPVNTIPNLERKKDIAARKAVVDFALYGGAGPLGLDAIPKLAQAGVVAFKTFLYPYQDRLDEFDGIFSVDDGELLDIFARVAETGLPEVVHAENYQIVDASTERLRAMGRTAPEDYEPSRPVIAELEAVSRCLLFARETGVRLYIPHVSSGKAMALIREAKDRGQTVYGETCPQYLFATREALDQVGPYGKIAPPLRSVEEQERLWELVTDGTVDTLGTDHAPHTLEAKERGWQDIFEAPAGMPGLETMLPLLLTAVNEGRLSLPRVVQLTAENVARIFGLYPRKGSLQPGSDADVVLVDLEAEGVLDPEGMYTRQKRTARLFAGRRVRGRPMMTLVRGRVVMRDGQVIGEPGYGSFVTPMPAKG